MKNFYVEGKKKEKESRNFLSMNPRSHKEKMKKTNKSLVKLKMLATDPENKFLLKDFKQENITVEEVMSGIVNATKDNPRSYSYFSLEKNLIKQGLESEDLATRLMNAIAYHFNDLAEELLKSNPGLIHQECDNRLPIFHALNAGNKKILKLLVEDFNAPLDVMDGVFSWDKRPFLHSVFSYESDAKVVGYFLKKGAPIDRKSSQGKTLLTVLLKTVVENGLQYHTPQYLSFIAEVIELLVHYKINVNALISDKTPIDYIRSSKYFLSDLEQYTRFINALEGKKGPNFYKNLAGDLNSETDKDIDKLCFLFEKSTTNVKIEGELLTLSPSLHFRYMSGNTNNNNNSNNNNQLAPIVTNIQANPSLDMKYT